MSSWRRLGRPVPCVRAHARGCRLQTGGYCRTCEALPPSGAGKGLSLYLSFPSSQRSVDVDRVRSPLVRRHPRGAIAGRALARPCVAAFPERRRREFPARHPAGHPCGPACGGGIGLRYHGRAFDRPRVPTVRRLAFRPPRRQDPRHPRRERHDPRFGARRPKPSPADPACGAGLDRAIQRALSSPVARPGAQSRKDPSWRHHVRVSRRRRARPRALPAGREPRGHALHHLRPVDRGPAGTREHTAHSTPAPTARAARRSCRTGAVAAPRKAGRGPDRLCLAALLRPLLPGHLSAHRLGAWRRFTCDWRLADHRLAGRGGHRQCERWTDRRPLGAPYRARRIECVDRDARGRLPHELRVDRMADPGPLGNSRV